MPNSNAHILGKDIEGRSFTPVNLVGGVDQETSKFSVREGTLGQSLNYNSSTRGYQRAQGLWYYDGTFDSAVKNMWVVAVDDDDASTFGSGFTLGGAITWGDNSSGVVVYYKRVSSATDYTLLGIVEITGAAPGSSDTLVDAETGTSLVLGATLTYEPTTIEQARYPDTGELIAGTVTDYLEFINNEVNADLVGQTGVQVNDYTTYHGPVPGLGRINGGWQYNDAAYVARDGYSCTFEYGTSEFVAGDQVVVELDSGTETVKVAYVNLTGGFWAQGTAAGEVVFMPSDSTTDYTSLADMNVAGYIRTADLSAATMAQIGSIDTRFGSLLWSGTLHGWRFIDTGWTIAYDTGSNAPNVKAAPLFQADLIASSRDVGFDFPDSGSNVGSAPYVAWTNPNNAAGGGSVTGVLGSGEISQYLKCLIPASVLPHDDIRIVGIEVQIESQWTAGGSGPVLTSLSLVNENTDANFFQSANKADNVSASGITATRYGGEGDTWGVEEISAEDMNSGNFGFMIQYYGTGSGGTVVLSDIKYKIYYVTNNEKVWFYNGSTDVATGEIHAYQIDKGDFGSANSASGNMSFTNMTSPAAIGVGTSMYTEPSGGGLLVAKVSEVPSYNILPSSTSMLAEDSQYKTITKNYYENDESEAVYGVTGAGPAFTFDGSTFAFLEAPLARAVDKPRHIAYHDNRLALGYRTGHVILSAIGVPNNFSAVDSASSWGVGDRVTGLISLAGNVLGVFSESSINSLQGSSESTGTMRTISSSTGAREYTLENIAGPYYADNRGVTSLDTSDKYGDFDMGRLSDPIRTWVQTRLQEKRTTNTLDTSPAAAVALRNKNEYRIYFSDGYILVFYFRADGSVEPSFMHYDTDEFGTDYVPTWINSHIMSSGSERVMMGTMSGDVWVVDGANLIQDPDGVIKPKCFLSLNPLNFGRPDALHKHYHVVTHGQFYGAQSISSWAGSNYLFNFSDSADDSITLGSYSNTPIFTAQSEVDSTYLPTLTDGFTIKLETTMDGSEPHTFQSLMFRSSRAGTDRNAAPKSY